jgi:hypothetical protein
MLPFLNKIETKKKALLIKNAEPERTGAELSEHLSKTLLDGVLSALPLSCRQMVLESDGVLAQLALIALMQSEKNKKKLHVARHKGKKTNSAILALIKKVKKVLGALRVKLKIIRKSLKAETRRKKTPFSHLKRKIRVRKKIKVLKKKGVKKKTLKKKSSLLGKGKPKKVIKAGNKQKRSGFAKLGKSVGANKVKNKSNAKVTNTKATHKKAKTKTLLKKGKLPSLKKPDGKAMGKAAKKYDAKQKKLGKLRLSMLLQKRERGKVDVTTQKTKKIKVANAPFFKKAPSDLKSKVVQTTKRPYLPKRQDVKSLKKTSTFKNSA